MSLTEADVRFAQQAAERARGRATGAERDARRAHESLQAAYTAAARTEAAAVGLFRTVRQVERVETHSRIADMYQLLAALTKIELTAPHDESIDRDGSGKAALGNPEAHDAPAWGVPDPRPAEAEAAGSPEAWENTFTLDALSDLADLRHQLCDLLEATGVSRSVVQDLALAVQEVASNGIRHGRPPVQVKVDHSSGRVVCAVIDRGAGFDWTEATDRPGAGSTLAEGRFGLRLAQELCDEVTTLKDAAGFMVRLVRHV